MIYIRFALLYIFFFETGGKRLASFHPEKRYVDTDTPPLVNFFEPLVVCQRRFCMQYKSDSLVSFLDPSLISLVSAQKHIQFNCLFHSQEFASQLQMQLRSSLLSKSSGQKMNRKPLASLWWHILKNISVVGVVWVYMYIFHHMQYACIQTCILLR